MSRTVGRWRLNLTRPGPERRGPNTRARHRREPGSAALYEMWPTVTRGRITAAEIASQVALDDYAVMLCGQMTFVADLARQFTAVGVPRERIITEEFEFR